jgi:hypothetical protein
MKKKRRTHSFIHASIHTYIRTHARTHINTYTHTYIRTYIIHTYIRTYIHTYMDAYIHTYMHACIHTYTHMHTHIHTYMHTLHTYIHKHRQRLTTKTVWQTKYGTNWLRWDVTQRKNTIHAQKLQPTYLFPLFISEQYNTNSYVPTNNSKATLKSEQADEGMRNAFFLHIPIYSR